MRLIFSPSESVNFFTFGIISVGFHEIYFFTFGIISVGFHEIDFFTIGIGEFFTFGIISVGFREMKFFTLQSFQENFVYLFIILRSLVQA
jgi:hypothetical protein